jgi:NUMOD4 motif
MGLVAAYRQQGRLVGHDIPSRRGTVASEERMTEQWRPVRGFEGLYEISDKGQVRSVDRRIPQRSRYGGVITVRRTGVLLAAFERRDGRRQVVLHDRHHRRHTRLIDQLVEDAFSDEHPNCLTALDSPPGDEELSNAVGQFGARTMQRRCTVSPPAKTG